MLDNARISDENVSAPPRLLRQGGTAPLELYMTLLRFYDAAVTYIDSSAVHAIIELYNNYKSRGIQVLISMLWLQGFHKIITFCKSFSLLLTAKKYTCQD